MRPRPKRQERDATSQGLAHRIHEEEILGAGQDKATSRSTLVHNALQVREEARNTLRLVEDHLGVIAQKEAFGILSKLTHQIHLYL